MSKDFKTLSKQNWTLAEDKDKPNLDQINTGCLQRIAEATEAMAQNYLRLQSDVEYLSRRNKLLISENDHLKRSAATYRGKYNSLKKKSKE